RTANAKPLVAELVRSTSGEVAGLSSRPEGFNSPTDYCLTKWWNWQTHGPQKAALYSGHGSSTLPLVTLAGWASAQQGLISPAVGGKPGFRYGGLPPFGNRPKAKCR